MNKFTWDMHFHHRRPVKLENLFYLKMAMPQYYRYVCMTFPNGAVSCKLSNAREMV